jgi:TIR domain
MKGYLQSFAYDVFLSYGWSGNLLPDEGDRGWAAQLFDRLNERLRTPLGKSPSVFIDRDANQGGYLSDRLAQALDSSAILLFVVSPGSCRPDSWCHKEAARFWDRGARPLVSDSRLILAPEDRIFKIVMSPVPTQSELPFLNPITGRNFYDSLPIGSDGPIARPADWSKLSPAVESEFLRLADDIANQLKSARQMEERPAAASGKRVFLGACPTDLNHERFRRLRRELLLEGHTVTSASAIPQETEAEFLLRTEDAMHHAQLAVFAIGETSQTPSNWRANHTALQLETAFRISEANIEFSVYAWEDPATVNLDQQCLERIKPNRKDQHICGGKAFEYLESNVLARLQIPSEPAVTERNENKTICIEYREEDGKVAAQICDTLRLRNIQVQLAIPTPAKGTLLNRISKKNQVRYYPNADGLVVFFGQGDYEWVSDVCFAMKQFVRPGASVIMLGPPQDKPPGKDQYDQPGFRSMKCFDLSFGKEFESWIGQLGPNKK